MNRIRMSHLLVTFLLFVAATATAQDLGIVLSQTTLSGAAGATLTFDATVTNLSSSTIFLNGDSSTTASAFLTVSDNPFLNNAPLSLAAGASSGPFAAFAVTIVPGIAVGSYNLNDFTILGGLTNVDFSPLGSTDFTVNVSPAPEPTTLLLVGSGLLGMGIKRRLWKQ